MCTWTPEVQCQEFHRNHVIWWTKIQNFDVMEMIRSNICLMNLKFYGFLGHVAGMSYSLLYLDYIKPNVYLIVLLVSHSHF
jgi:hypothetical protein